MALDVGELVARLTIDDTRFTRSVDENTRRVSRFETEVKQSTDKVDRHFRDSTGSVGKLGTAADGAARDVGRVGRGAQDVDKVGASAKRTADEVGKIGQAAGKAGDGMTNLAGQVSSRAGIDGGGNFLAGFSEKVGSLGSKGGPIAGSLLGVTALGLAAGAVLAKAIADGMEQEKQQDLIQAKLGVNEETARRIGQAAGAAYSNGWGESVTGNMDTARRAIQGGILTGEEDTSAFQGTIEQLDIISAKLDGDVSDSVQAVGALMTSGLAKDAQQAFDLIARASDGTANKGEDLLEVIREYSSGWKQAGFSAEFTMGLISQATDNGVDNADRAGDAIREFGRRIYEEGDTIKETLSDLGLDAGTMYEQFTAGGPAAEDAFDQVFDAIRKIEDPVKRATAAQALLGDTAGDFIGTFTQWDPSQAVKRFGDVEGAAKRAGDTMSSNTAASFDEARRSIETSSDSIKLALAEAFGPALQDVANWVSTHKPEIIGFFTSLADAGFATLDATLAFTSGALRGWATFAEGVGGAAARIIEPMAAIVRAQANVVDLIPGMGGQADDLRGIADAMSGFASTVGGAGDQARGLADAIDAGRPKLQGMRDDVREAGEQAENSERLIQALGTAVVEDVPDGKTITISDNSPDAVQRLEALGFKVENTPNGIRVTANTSEAETILDDYLNQDREMTVRVKLVRTALGSGVSDIIGVPAAADGGITKAPDQATIVPASGPNGRLIQMAEDETEGEAFIPLAESKRPRSRRILQDVATRFGFGLVKMADGGVVEGMSALVNSNFPALTITDSYRPGANDNHGAGLAIDVSNGYGNTDEQLAFANWVADNYPNSKELIYDDPRFDRQIKEGRIVDSGFYAGAGDHTNHVHWAMGSVPGAASGGGVEQVTVEGGDLDGVIGEPGAPRRGDQGAIDENDPKGRSKYGPGGTKSGATDSGVGISTDGQRVFVTNWPSGASAELTASTPAPAPSTSGGGGEVSRHTPTAPTPTPAPTTFEAPPTPAQRLGDWAAQAGPDLAEAWGIPKPGGVLGAVLSPEVQKTAGQAVDGISKDTATQLDALIRHIQELIFKGGDTFVVANIDEALRKRDQRQRMQAMTYSMR